MALAASGSRKITATWAAYFFTLSTTLTVHAQQGVVLYDSLMYIQYVVVDLRARIGLDLQSWRARVNFLARSRVKVELLYTCLVVKDKCSGGNQGVPGGNDTSSTVT